MSGNFHLIAGKFDEAFDEAQTNRYRLAILLSINGVAYSIFDSHRNYFFGFEQYVYTGKKNNESFSKTLKDFVQSNKYLSYKYNGIKIIYEPDSTSLVPAALFEKKFSTTYAQFALDIKEDIILTDRLVNLDAFNLFAMPAKIYETVSELFPGGEVHSHISVLIESFLINYKSEPSRTNVLVNIRKQKVDILVVRNNAFLFQNSFNFFNEDDLIYFILLVLDILKIGAEEVELRITGMTDRHSGYFEKIYQYVLNVGFEKLPDVFTYSYVFNEAMGHKFYNLLNVFRCEL